MIIGKLLQSTRGKGKMLLSCLVLLFGIWVVTFSAKMLWRAVRGTPQLDSAPVVLAVRKLGTLHTVEMNMKEVLVQESSKEAEGWLAGVPGADAVMKWATTNSATVTAEGTVEAGVDLSQISEKNISVALQPDGTKKIILHLPPVTIYPPNVKLNVNSTQSALFWNDENIVPKAEAEAARRFIETAERGNIRAKAQVNAIELLKQFQQTTGTTPIEYTFDPTPVKSVTNPPNAP
jgi:hypothetical protein